MPSNKKKSKKTRGWQRKDSRGRNHPAVHHDSPSHATRDEPDPESPPASQTRDTASSGSDSFRDENARSDADHSVDRGRRGQVSGPSPASLSEDSGFTSSSAGATTSPAGRGRTAPQVVQALSDLGIELVVPGLHKTSPLPRRPGFGSLGKKVRLVTNCYELTVPDGDVYHYDVEVVRLARNPENDSAPESRAPRYRCLKTREKREVVQRMVERDAAFDGLYPAYDGEKNLLTRRPIPATFPHVFETGDADEIRARVRIKPVKKEDKTSCAISMDAVHSYFEGRSGSVPAESMAALETILRHGPCLRFAPIGRSFFSPPGPGCLNPIAGGLEIWYGFHQSVRIGQWKPTVNLDVSATTFYPGGPLLDYMAAFLDTPVDALRSAPFLADRDIRRLNKKLKGRRIETTHCRQPRKYTVIGLARENAHQLPIAEGGPTVARYFRERYGIDLRFPNLPCLRVNPEERRVYIPVELCRLVPGQHYNDPLTQAQLSEMIKFTACAPKQRFQKISNIRHFMDDPCVREFGIGVSEVPLGVEGRTLDSPSLIYRFDKKVRPRDDSWNMRDAQFFSGADIKSWALLAFGGISGGRLETFGRLLTETGRKLGVEIGRPGHTGHVGGQDLRVLLEGLKRRGHDLVVVVFPENDQAVYRHVKKSAETVVGLNTQCIRERNVLKVTDPGNRCSAQLVANLFLKINAKTGGVNYSLVLSEIPSILWKPVIIMGADVNHPGSYRGLRESMAACSGSLDARCSMYAVRAMPQKNENPKKNSAEIISDLEAMTKDLLRAFYSHTKKMKPEKIIFYRDGVSEGEFLKVRDREVASLRKACRDLGADYEPGITFVVVQKRHHVRFMTEGSELNVPSKTVIDNGVTHKDNFDFFLCSHKSVKGTARAPHYTVLEDDNGFTADDIQKLTNQLCYCYVRCTKGISIPAPVAYADLAAYRTRQYLDAERDGSNSAASTYSQSDQNLTTLEEAIGCTRVVQEMKNRMYFV